MNIAKTLIIAGGGWLAWEALKSVTSAVATVKAANTLPGMNLNTADDYPGAVDASQGADVASPSNLLPPIYGPMGPPSTNDLPIAIPTYTYNPPDAPATIVANNPAAANPPSSSVLPSTTPVQSPTLPDLNPSTPTTTTPTTTTPTTAPATQAPAPTAPVVQVSPYSTAGAGRLAPGQAMNAGSELRSPDGRYRLQLLADGLLTFKSPSDNTLWQSQTRDQGVVQAQMLASGYFRLVKSNGTVARQWGNGTPNSAIHVTNAGKVILYAPTGAVIWSVS